MAVSRVPTKTARAKKTHPRKQQASRSDQVTLFLAGDVMIGRGIDQVLPHPGDPRLHESYAASAAYHVSVAEAANGPIPRPVDYPYVWGHALAELDRRKPDLRLINLETAITKSGEPEPKGINYRMSPENSPVLTAAGVDCCILANNHVLDWGQSGLVETLETLESIGVKGTGAGRNLQAAAGPAILSAPGGRVIVFALASPTSGAHHAWAATEHRPGVYLLPDLSRERAAKIASRIRALKRAGDIVIISLRWGRNWGYEISDQQTAFAHRLIDDADTDVVWGHSSHHPKAIEVHNGKLILYGCGDFLDDYEGINGYEHFRDDLVLMYFPTIRLSNGTLNRLTMVPLQIRNFRLKRASRTDATWLCDVLNREGEKVGTRVWQARDNSLTLEWE